MARQSPTAATAARPPMTAAGINILISFYWPIPEKPRKAKDMIPAVTRATAVPRMAVGTGERNSRSRTPAKRRMARANPAALAAEKMKGTDFFVVDQSSWETSANAGYWIWHGKGVSQPHVGPFESETIDCHGAGFFDKDDSWGEGICIHGEGADTRTSSWKREKCQE